MGKFSILFRTIDNVSYVTIRISYRLYNNPYGGLGMGLNMVRFLFVIIHFLYCSHSQTSNNEWKFSFYFPSLLNVVNSLFPDESVRVHTAESGTKYDTVVFATDGLSNWCRTRTTADESNVLSV